MAKTLRQRLTGPAFAHNNLLYDHYMTLDKLFPLYVRYGIKMGIACFLSWSISHAIGTQYGLWSVVATLVAMQVNVAESFQQGRQRVIGTVLGAALGVGLLLVVPPHPLALGLSVFFIALTCGYLTRFSTISPITAIAAVVVLLLGSQNLGAGYMDAVSVGLIRVLEIVIGVGCAFFVTVLLWPVRLVDTLRADLGLQFHESARILDALLNAFLTDQQALSYDVLKKIESRGWENHERLTKARRHESLLFHYEHQVMKIQVTALDRTTESLRSMLEALNDYDEEGRDPLIGKELRELGDAIMAALRHLGGGNPTTPAPDLIRGLTGGVGLVEQKLAYIRREGKTHSMHLHKVLQIYAFYQSMRLLAEALLMAIDSLAGQNPEKAG